MAIALPVLVVGWVIRFVTGLRAAQESLRARVEALERAVPRQPQL